MKRLLFILLLSTVFIGNNKAIDISVNYAIFQGNESPYIELYFNVIGKTLEKKSINAENDFQSAVEILILFKKDENIVNFDKYILNSPVFRQPLNFFDQRRYPLQNGNYNLEIDIHDVNSSLDEKKHISFPISINFDNNNLQQSDIQLLAAYSKDSSQSNLVKNGYKLENLPFNFVDKNYATLAFYHEIYNSDKAIGSDFSVSYIIEKINGNNEKKQIQISHKRKSPAPIVAMLMQLDISKLESGNYQLTVEVRNRIKELLSAKTISFQRSNPYLDISRDSLNNSIIENEFVQKLKYDSLRYSLKAISMLVLDDDVVTLNTILLQKDTTAMRRFLFNYWLKKDHNQPEAIYLEYMNIAQKVDKKFANGFGFGFETDRGRIFLKYGQPNDIITSEQEPDAPPYEIWSYYQFAATNQNNVKFIFYNPDLTNNGFILLHSNARGELNNPRWQAELYKNALGNQKAGSNTVQDGLRRNASRLFNDN